MVPFTPKGLQPLSLTKLQQNQIFYLFSVYFSNNGLDQYGFEGEEYFLIIKNNERKLIHWLQLVLFEIPGKIIETEKGVFALTRFPIFIRNISKTEHPVDFLWSFWKETFAKERDLPDFLKVTSKPKIGFKV